MTESAAVGPTQANSMHSIRGILSIPVVQTIKSVRSESSGPYAVSFQSYEHAKFVAVLRGRFDIQVSGEARAVSLERGDCYLLTTGQGYRVFNAEVPELDAATLCSADRGSGAILRWGNSIPDTVTIGCRTTFNREGAAWLREWLPPFIRIPGDTPEADRFRVILTLLCADSDEALGAAFTADRCVGILLVQALRQLRARIDGNTPGWLKELSE